ncbi:S8 family serine peptidase [Deinococcus oregonensis]|uniref:S8 family serine peptidase n=1 Tax=Deinococcus oregonensis TaxID=1805970 RepID=A0ABV6B6M6_9DEIO
MDLPGNCPLLPLKRRTERPLVSRVFLLLLSALSLGACGTSPLPSSATLPQSITSLSTSSSPPSAKPYFSSSGARLWAEGARLWGEGGFSLPSSSRDWRQQVNVPETQAFEAGKGVTIALLDSGVDLTHPMLRGVLLPGHDFVDGDENPSEEGDETDLIYGHGTAVAGVLQQMAPAARILPLRVLGTGGSGQAAHVAQAIRLAVDQGAHIINLSVAGSVSSEGVRAALQYAANRNVLVVAASGNNGESAPQAPADALNQKNTLGAFGLSVTAVDQSGNLPSWSNRGGEVQAPGVDILTSYPGRRLVRASGSSFAAPVVSGALALALAQGKDAQTLAAQLSTGSLLDVKVLLK